jgi:TusE/DsrC/DsvC family sulfur relay protein
MQHVLRQPEFDEYGLLRDPADWTPDLARDLARGEGLTELGPQHWAFLNALRDYYQRFRVPPPTARLCHELHLKHGCGHMLFPSCLAAWRIAGLPDPGEEAKSYLSAE